MWVSCAFGHDVDQALVGRARLAGERALPDRVAGGVAGLVLVGGEQVEVLLALGEVEAGVAHVRALLGGDDVERLLGQVAAEVDGTQLHAGVAARSRRAWSRCRGPRRGPSPGSGRASPSRPGGRTARSAPACSAWPSKSGAEAVLADLALGVLADHGERVRVLRGAGLVDQVDDLDRLARAARPWARGRTRRRSRTRRWRRRTCPRRGRARRMYHCCTSSGCSSTACSSEHDDHALLGYAGSSGRGRCWRRAGRSGRRAPRRRGPRARSRAARRAAS